MDIFTNIKLHAPTVVQNMLFIMQHNDDDYLRGLAQHLVRDLIRVRKIHGKMSKDNRQLINDLLSSYSATVRANADISLDWYCYSLGMIYNFYNDSVRTDIHVALYEI